MSSICFCLVSELEDAEITWSQLLKRLPFLATTVPNAESLISDVVTHAEKLDTFVGKTAYTRIHGDCKGFNLFLNKTNDDILFIDMQWTGSGNPLQVRNPTGICFLNVFLIFKNLQDVAYVLTTTLQADLLSQMDNLVDYYCDCLSSHLSQSQWNGISKAFRASYDLIWLDYARMIMTGLWKKLSEEYMERCQNTIGPSMINRSKDHAIFIINRVHFLMGERKVIDMLSQQE